MYVYVCVYVCQVGRGGRELANLVKEVKVPFPKACVWVLTPFQSFSSDLVVI